MASAPRLRVPPAAQLGEAHEKLVMESIGDTTASLAGKAGRPWLLSFAEMPEWFQHENNKWILHGYRPISNSIYVSYCSWSYLHNETLNIFSHFIPGIVVLLGQYYIRQYLTSKYPGRVTSTDLIVWSFFGVAGIISFNMSANYHTLLNHSPYVDSVGVRIDMLGLTLYAMSDLILATHIIFWCESVPRNIYWSLIGSCGSLTIFLTMHPKYQGAKYRTFRALMFVMTGMSGFAPIVHGIFAFGPSMMANKGLLHTLAKAACLLSGTAMYAHRWPESSYPGKFDLWGSHTIFHVLVVCAVAISTMGHFSGFNYAQRNFTCASR